MSATFLKLLARLTAGTLLLVPLASYATPEMLDVIVPQYIQGINGTNSRRVPYAFRVKFTGLLSNATYRYINQVIISSDGPTVNGAGNCIFPTTSGNFAWTNNPAFNNPGAYGEFTTDASGEAEVWMITEPTGNSRFTPGTVVYMRVRINDGAGGTTVAQRFTTTAGAIVQDLVTNSTGFSGIRGNSLASSRDFVFLYDNTDGTGRPLSGTLVEDDGYAMSTSTYAYFYYSFVDGIPGAWGSVIPNNLTAGVRRIERRSLTTGQVVAFNADDDGIWPSGANTVNATNGPDAIVMTTADAPLPEPACTLLLLAVPLLLRKSQP